MSTEQLDGKLDERVVTALNNAAFRVRMAARTKAEEMAEGIKALIKEEAKGYGIIATFQLPVGHRHWGTWVEELCREIGKQIGDEDVSRMMEELSETALKREGVKDQL